jgi:chromosome segregation ATPase
VVVTVLQEQVYSKKMFNERADAVERVTALQEQLQQELTKTDANQKHAHEQQQQQQQQISALMQECEALKAKVLSLGNDAYQFKEQSAAASAASAAAASARILEIESQNSAAVATAQQQVPCTMQERVVVVVVFSHCFRVCRLSKSWKIR